MGSRMGGSECPHPSAFVPGLSTYISAGQGIKSTKSACFLPFRSHNAVTSRNAKHTRNLKWGTRFRVWTVPVRGRLFKELMNIRHTKFQNMSLVLIHRLLAHVGICDMPRKVARRDLRGFCGLWPLTCGGACGQAMDKSGWMWTMGEVLPEQVSPTRANTRWPVDSTGHQSRGMNQ